MQRPNRLLGSLQFLGASFVYRNCVDEACWICYYAYIVLLKGRRFMRSKNSIRNVIVNVGSQILYIALSFFCRTVFIRMLDESYLGLNGYFSNILTIFSLAELGFGTAITFSM